MKKRANNYKILIFLLYLLIITYITLFSRIGDTGVDRGMKIFPFWSYLEWIRGDTRLGLNIILNIVLFFPIGCFLTGITFPGNSLSSVVFLSLMISTVIEVLQYLTGLGQFELDDLINNVLGAVLGSVVCSSCYTYLPGIRKEKIPSILLLSGGFLGCILVHFEPPVLYTIRDFDFRVDSVELADDSIKLDGICRVYVEDTPSYQVILIGEESGKKYKTSTMINDEHYTAEVRKPIHEKCEIIIKFDKHGTAASGVYLNQSSIEYVPGIVPEPRVFVEKIPDLVKKAVLLAYDPEYDVYVYQCQNKMHWLIGKDIDERTEIIYLIFTDEVSKLPKNRIEYGFDNLGFYMGGTNQKADVGNYKHFEAEIPKKYHITAIRVGYNKDNQILWSQFIRKLP